MKLPRTTGGTYGPKAGLVAGCDYRACVKCKFRVFVPAHSNWTTCMVCKREA